MDTGLYIGPDNAPDRYRLLRSIGRGGEAVLYLAELELSGATEPVVVKVLDARQTLSQEMFSRISTKWQEQAELLRFVHRLGVVGIREHFEGPSAHPAGRAPAGGTAAEGRALYLVMNHVEGLDLRDWRAERTLDTAAERREAVRCLEQLADVLDWLHSGAATPSGRTVVHGDLSPGNVMIDANGQATLVDFGLSKLTADHQTAEVWFTPGFAAPEVFEGKRSPASDRYAFGAIAYFLLSGDSPGTMPETVRAAMLDLPELVALGEEKAGRITGIFANDPALRPDSLTAWIKELRPAVISTTSRPPRTPARPPGPAPAPPPAVPPPPAHAPGMAATTADPVVPAPPRTPPPPVRAPAPAPVHTPAQTPPVREPAKPPVTPAPVPAPVPVQAPVQAPAATPVAEAENAAPSAPEQPAPAATPVSAAPTPAPGPTPSPEPPATALPRSPYEPGAAPVTPAAAEPTPPAASPPPSAYEPRTLPLPPSPYAPQPPEGESRPTVVLGSGGPTGAGGGGKGGGPDGKRRSRKPRVVLATVIALLLVGGGAYAGVALSGGGGKQDDASGQHSSQGPGGATPSGKSSTHTPTGDPTATDDSSSAPATMSPGATESLTTETPADDNDSFTTENAEVNGKQYYDALVTDYCDGGYVEYNLGRHWTDFNVLLGVDDNARDLPVMFTISADGNQLFHSQVTLGKPTQKSFDVSGALRLRVQWEAQSDSDDNCGTGVLADPTLVR